MLLVRQWPRCRSVSTLRGGEVEISLAKKRMCDPESETRVREARGVLARQENIAKWNKWADTSLTFSQYIVGGVLASSFIQSALAPELIGFLGVLVLASKLIHQHYRPDVSSRTAKHRATRLRSLIRTAEDGLYAIRSGQKSVPTLLAIRTRMSDGLSEIERAELQGLDGDNSGTGDNEPPSAARPRGTQTRPRRPLRHDIDIQCVGGCRSGRSIKGV